MSEDFISIEAVFDLCDPKREIERERMQAIQGPVGPVWVGIDNLLAWTVDLETKKVQEVG